MTAAIGHHAAADSTETMIWKVSAKYSGVLTERK